MNSVILAFIIGVSNNGVSIQMNNAFSQQFESQPECNKYVEVKNIMLTTSLYDALNTIDPKMDWNVKGFMCIPKEVYDKLPKVIKEGQEQEGIEV